MIEEQLEKFILSRNLYKLETNLDKVGVYYNEADGCCNILIVYYAPEKWDAGQQHQVYQQVRQRFFSAGRIEQRVLSVAVTEQPQTGRNIFAENDIFWIVNPVTGQVMLYEDQSGDFCNLREPLEQWLYEWRMQLIGKANPLKKVFARLPLVTILLLVCNVAIFLAGEWAWIKHGNEEMTSYGALNAGRVLESGEYYRLFTYMFLHGGIDHIVNNMLILFCIGSKMEQLLGRCRYLFVYFASGILAGIASMSYNILIDRDVNCVGASGAIFGITGALAAVVLIHRGKVEQLTGRQIVLFIALSLYGGFVSQGVDNAAHIGGLVAGFILTLLVYRRRRFAHPKQRE